MEMRLEIVRLEGHRPPIARHRLVEPAELGQNPAEIAVDFRPVRHQVERTAERGLGFGKAP